MFAKLLKKYLFYLAIPLLAAGLSFVAVKKISYLYLAERSVSDRLVGKALPNEPQDPDVVVVGIDEDTLGQFPYREPVDRGFLAGLLKTLEQDKARAIGLDVLFDTATEPEKDELLKTTIATLKVPLSVSWVDNPAMVTEDELDYLNKFVPEANRVWANEPEDPADGEVRDIPPGEALKDGKFALGFARGVAKNVGVETPRAWQEIAWHGFDTTEPDEPPFYTARAGLLAAYPPETFAGKIVLIGYTGSLKDRHRTPLDAGSKAEGQPGIIVHAHSVSQLIHGRHVRRLSVPEELGFLFLMAALGTLFGTINHSLVRHLVMSAITLGALLLGLVEVWLHFSMVLPAVGPTMSFLLSVWGTDALTGREARKQREFINGAFTRYLNPSLVKQLADDPNKLQLGGEMRDMTLLFCDIRGFTTISEKFDAQGLTRFINRFLTPMTDLIMASGGTIDKYMGDAIMAFWNAPLDDAAHAEHGCRCALAMRSTLVELNTTWAAEAAAAGQAHIPVNIGIGLNSGICCVGNVGSDQRFDYSVLGDDVNLASRLEGQSKTYHLDLVIGARTAAAVPMLATLELDSIMVKGKTEPVHVFTVVGDEAVAADPTFVSLKTEHDAMLVAFRSQDWAGAKRHLQNCRTYTPPLMVGFYDVYEERIAAYEASPPSPDWDGVYVALTK